MLVVAIIFFLLGAIPHLIIKIFDFIEKPYSKIIDTISLIGYLVFTTIYFMHFKGNSIFIFSIFVEFIYTSFFLFILIKFNIIYFSKHLPIKLFGLIPVSIILWFYILVSQAIMAASFLFNDVNVIYISFLSSSIITIYLTFALPIIQANGIWGITKKGHFFNTSWLIYLLFFVVFSILSFILVATFPINSLGNISIMPVVFFCWLILMSFLSIIVNIRKTIRI